MKLLYALIIICYCCLCSITVTAQEIPRNFTTLTYNKALQFQGENATSGTNNSSQLISQTEQQTAEIIRLNSTFEEKTIPVVFHILYANETQNVSIERVEYQLAALNNHFALSEVIENHPNDPNSIYAKRAVDTKIRFCLATEVGNGNPIEAIHYVPTTVAEWTEIAGIKQSENGAVAINPNGIFNIWIAALPAENAGFAQMPNRGALETDGVVINYRYFGASNNEFGFKTLTFLVGQFLNLYPLSGHSLDFPCSDDFVDDTPISNSRNSGCPSGNHISLCESKNGRLVPEMVMNFMSANTDDNCKYMFSRQQAARMQAVLDTTGVRHDLVLGESICGGRNISEVATPRNSNDITNKLSNKTLIVYPNPANTNITIELTDISVSPSIIEILTSEGKLVFSKKINGDSGRIKRNT